MPVTVNDCAVPQFDVVNVTASDTDAFAGVPLVGVTVTSPVGWVLSTAV